jgi:hypothetical protein
LGLGVWGCGFGVWGFGPIPQSPIPNPQSPIPNPQLNSKLKKYKYNLNFYIFKNEK